MHLGEKLRNLRLKLGLTQEELAERSDLTKGFISQVENNNTSPSVETMEGIVSALGLTMAEFFQEPVSVPVVYSAKDTFVAEHEDLGLRIRWLVPSAQMNMMEPTLMKLTPGGHTKAYHPFEGESFGYVLEGILHLRLGSEVYEVQPGECFYFAADQVFQVENRSDQTAHWLWVLTPPNF